MSRKINDLFWAKESERPAVFGKSRPRGTKALGARYEKLVAQALPSAKHGLWFQFQDLNGRGYCQPDFLLFLEKRLVVVECKLSNYFQACDQITYLYKPILEEVYSLPMQGIVIQKRLRASVPKHVVCRSLQEAFSRDGKLEGRLPLVHWLGNEPRLLDPHTPALSRRDLAPAYAP